MLKRFIDRYNSLSSARAMLRLTIKEKKNANQLTSRAECFLVTYYYCHQTLTTEFFLYLFQTFNTNYNTIATKTKRSFHIQ